MHSSLTFIEDADVGHEEGEEVSRLGQLQDVPALVGQQQADVDGKVHLVGQPRPKGHLQLFVVAEVGQVRGQTAGPTQVIWCQATVWNLYHQSRFTITLVSLSLSDIPFSFFPCNITLISLLIP